MKGLRTLGTNAVFLSMAPFLFSMLEKLDPVALVAKLGWEASAGEAGVAIATAVLALVNIGLRWITTTPVGKSE